MTAVENLQLELILRRLERNGMAQMADVMGVSPEDQQDKGLTVEEAMAEIKKLFGVV